MNCIVSISDRRELGSFTAMVLLLATCNLQLAIFQCLCVCEMLFAQAINVNCFVISMNASFLPVNLLTLAFQTFRVYLWSKLNFRKHFAEFIVKFSIIRLTFSVFEIPTVVSIKNAIAVVILAGMHRFVIANPCIDPPPPPPTLHEVSLVIRFPFELSHFLSRFLCFICIFPKIKFFLLSKHRTMTPNWYFELNFKCNRKIIRFNS